MIVLRFLLIAFNVGIVAFLIYKMVEFSRQPVERSKKITFFLGSFMLLLVPFGIFFRAFVPSPSYLIVYPVAIAVFLYLTRQL